MPEQLPLGDVLEENKQAAIEALVEIIDHYKNEHQEFYAFIKDHLNLPLVIKHAGHLTLEEKYKLHQFYKKLQQLEADFRDLKPLAPTNVINNKQQVKQELLAALQSCIRVLGTKSNSFKKYKLEEEKQFKKNSQQFQQAEKETLNRQDIKTFHRLCHLLNNARSWEANRALTETETDILKKALGKSLFDFFVNRYNLDPNQLDLDCVRMFMVGVSANMSNELIQSKFIDALCYIFKKTADYSNATLNPIDVSISLKETLLRYNDKDDLFKDIQKDRPTKRIDRLFNFIRRWLPENMKYWIPQRFKVNENFTNDLASATLMAHINKWQRKLTFDEDKTNRDTIDQHCASHEYLFHKLAYQDFEDGTIVPVIEKDGSKKYYQAYDLSCYQSGDEDPNAVFASRDVAFRSMALVPLEPSSQQPIEIKVLFRGTYSVMSALIDTEQYGAGYKTYRNNEAKFLNRLNQVVGKIKAQNPRKKISLTAGGHSLGGALTQYFSGSMMCAQLYPLYQQYLDDKKALLDELMPIITKQIAYEKNVGYTIDKNISAKKRAQELIKTLDKYHQKHQSKEAQIKQRADQIKNAKALLKDPTNLSDAQKKRAEKDAKKLPTPEQYVVQLEDNHLQNIETMHFVTVNGAGCADKQRRRFADGLAFFKTKLQKTIQYTNIIVAGDVVQQTGQANISNAIPSDHMPVETIKINSGLEGLAKKNVIKVAGYYLLSALALKFGFLSPIINFLGLSSKDMYKISNALTSAHCDLHFDQKKAVVFKHLENSNPQTKEEQVKELGTKMLITHNKTFQASKKRLGKWSSAASKTATKANKKRKALTHKMSKFIIRKKNKSRLLTRAYNLLTVSVDFTSKILNSEKVQAAILALETGDPIENVEYIAKIAIKELGGHLSKRSVKKTVLNNIRQKAQEQLARGEIDMAEFKRQIPELITKAVATGSFEHFKKTFKKNIPKNWQITGDQLNGFSIIPKIHDQTKRLANKIQVHYQSEQDAVEFQLNSSTPGNETIDLMVDNALSCGESLTIDCSEPKLLQQTLKSIAQNPVAEIYLSERAQALLDKINIPENCKPLLQEVILKQNNSKKLKK